MSKLNDLIQQYCPNGVEYKHIWEITSWDKRFKEVENSKQSKIDKYHYYFAAELDSIIDKSGDVKVLTTNKTDLHTTDELAGNNIVNAEIVCIPGGGNPIVQYYNGKFVTGDNRIARVLDINELNAKYLYYVMNSQLKTIASFYRGSCIKHPAMASVLNLEIPVPPFPVQEEIVRILDKFTELEQELEQELELRKKQYEYYRDKMLSLSDYNGEVDMVPLSECTIRLKGSPVTAGQMKYMAVNNGTITIFGGGATKIMTNEEHTSKFKIISTPSVLIKSRGIVDVEFCDFPYTFKQEMWAYAGKENLNSKYLYYFLQTQVPKLRVKGSQMGSMPQIKLDDTESINVPIIDIKEQNRIVEILDKFSILTSDISEGLPAEIKMRHQQYEYYRDKLLNFKKLEVA